MYSNTHVAVVIRAESAIQMRNSINLRYTGRRGGTAAKSVYDGVRAN